MIGSLRGNIIYKNEKYCIVEAGNVGYKVFATLDTIETTDAHLNTLLYIYTVVREDAFELFGFLDIESLELFEKLVGVSGIGPRSALGILSLAPIDTLKEAIISGDSTYLTKVSGVGKKSAEKIVLELRDTLSKGYVSKSSTGQSSSNKDIYEAMESLGYRDGEIREALKEIDMSDKNTEEIIKLALKNLVQ